MRRIMGRVLLLSLVLLSIENVALAQRVPDESPVVSVPLGDAPAASQLKVDKEFQYYGWQSLLIDAVVFGLGTAVNPLAFVLLLPSGPVIHAVHRNFLMMGISSGVRGLGALLFLIGGIQAFGAGFHSDPCHEMGEPRCEPEPADGSALMTAGGVLILGAVIMDFALGFRRVERKPTAGVQLQPFVAPSARGAGAGLALSGLF